MDIYLTPPGGQPQGPFSLEEINRNLAAQKYRDTDYWAWYRGQREWVPLYQVPGVTSSDTTVVYVVEPKAVDAAATTEAATAGESEAGERTMEEPTQGLVGGQSGDTVVLQKPESPPPQPEGAPATVERELATGLPSAALEQVFLLTTGDGPAASRSRLTGKMLEESVGEPLDRIRAEVARDVIAHCSFVEQLRTKGALPAVAWRAMANFKPDLVQQARAGRFKICVRTFPIESGDLVCLFLFYNKEKL